MGDTPGSFQSLPTYLADAANTHEALCTGVAMLAATPVRLTTALRTLNVAEGEDAMIHAIQEAYAVEDWLAGQLRIMQAVMAQLMIVAEGVA